LVEREPVNPSARVVVNGGARAFHAEPGRPLLFCLMGQTILVPSACGGRASCGQCRVRVLSGAGGHNEKEAAILSPAERASGVHLSCQVTVRGDIEISIPETSLRALPYATRVAVIRDLSPGLREIELDLQQPAEIRFKPGQYVQFLLPGTESAEAPVYRAYSIASSPSSASRIRLLFGLVPGGACSTYAFERIRVGDAIRVNGPFGEFFVRDGERHVIFVAAGSGMAPIRSMLTAMAERQERRPLTLFCAARTAGGLVYVQELQSLSDRLPSLEVIPTLTHPLPGDGWTGERGGVAALLARRLPALTDHEAYLCGGPGMIDASITVLRSKGLEEGRIFFDKFS
jgi:Na+-transporting NADH:ubiquinone oxidoreductase subunit F